MSVAPLVYPLWLALRSHRRPDRTPPEPVESPGLSVVIPAYREREVIAAKVEDVRRNGYPGELEMLVVTEDPPTAEAARATNARVLNAGERLGKAEAVNRGVAAASQPIVVLTDADTRLERGSLAALARWFADPDVGAVAGEKRVEWQSPGLWVGWERRTRTIAGLLDLLWRRRRLLVPRSSPVSVELWGHKLMRATFGPLAHAALIAQALTSFPRSRLAAAFLAGHLAALVASARAAPTLPERFAAHRPRLGVSSSDPSRRSDGGLIAHEQPPGLQLGREAIDVRGSTRALDLKGVDQPIDQLFAGCALDEDRPQNLACAVDRQVARLTQVEDDKLTLHLAPIEVRVPQC